MQSYELQQPPPQPQAGPGPKGPYAPMMPMPNNGAPPSYDQVFQIPKPKYNDLWAGLLFLATSAGFVAVSGISLRGYATNPDVKAGSVTGLGSASHFGLTRSTAYLFGWVLCTAVVLSYIYIWLARAFTKTFIWISGLLNIALAIGTAVYMLYRKYWSGGIVFAIFAIFLVFAFISWIPRIPFSALMLQTVIDVSKRHGHVYLVSAMGGFVGAAFGAWFAVTMVGVYTRYDPGTEQKPNPVCENHCSSAIVAGLIVFITFYGYWATEVLKNVLHVTISGVYGSWYFYSQNYPTKVTRGALRRAVTYSFGSISFGSLVVAIINFLRQLCSVAQSQASADGDMIGYVLFCILGCLISLLDWAVQFINRYAFCHIALYGKAYIPAAKDTWRMIKDRGIDALVNECLIGPVLTTGGMFVAYSCSLLAYLYLILTKPEYNSTNSYTPVVVTFSFLIGLQICNIFTTPLSSGIDTLFVAMAWDPEVMIRDHGDLYHQMIQVYPHVQQAIHA